MTFESRPIAGIRIRIGLDLTIVGAGEFGAWIDAAGAAKFELLEFAMADASMRDWLTDPDVIIATVRIIGEMIATRQSRFILRSAML